MLHTTQKFHLSASNGSASQKVEILVNIYAPEFIFVRRFAFPHKFIAFFPNTPEYSLKNLSLS